MGKINEHKSVIYQIRNIVNQKIYVGSASNFAARKGSHLFHLRRNQHINTHLQRAYNKYGETQLVFEILEYVDMIDDIEVFRKKLLEREQYWIDKLEVCNQNKGYNINIKADSRLGVKHTEESKRKISIHKKGKYAGQNNHFYGKKHSKETRIKMSESGQGKGRGSKNVKAKLTEEQVIEIDKMLKENISVADIAKIYNMEVSSIQSIKVGKNWSHLTGRNRENIEIKPIKIISDQEVLEIKKWLYKNKHCDQSIADIVQVRIDTVSNIRRGITYNNINLSEDDIMFLEDNPEQYLLEPSKLQYLSLEQVIEVKYLFLKGYTRKQISEFLDIKKHSVDKIIAGKTWSHIKLEDYLDDNGNIKLVI